MTFDQIIDTIKNLGVPVAILVWLFWRGDFFLRYFVHKLDKFNDELTTINTTLQDLIHAIKNGKSR